MVSIKRQDSNTTVVLSPNRSMSWATTRLVMIAICAFTMTIAILFAFAGVWMVLPFAGLEMLCLCSAMYFVSWQQSSKQVILADCKHGRLVVEKGIYHIDQKWQFKLQDTAIAVTDREQDWSPFEICLFDHEQRHCIGEFLNRDDCDELLSQLKTIGLPLRCRGEIGMVEF
ncbi:hypothetical protein SIN8267_01499 [Sinobacterium norvegicum]|uniref:DUF2244 domain-containing protein n=1 Tax=Sinobacterium norvegicum TaxID=1641715 RepID=A0ABN8EJT3_9GAMM|nr:DUF2244 domain-containing protein [Sinobacterium norvegicum]CAH0991395.1 hypothetical protein SIN8267_01499 [Sinobacterium norvegicum]